MPSSREFLDMASVGTYKRPSLKIYGEMTRLTASGVSGTAEGGSQPNCSNDTKRKPC
jgi:hypothetical protein